MELSNVLTRRNFFTKTALTTVGAMVFTNMNASATGKKDSKAVREVYKQISPNYGKSVGVFGGSLSVTEESEMAKSIWAEKLNLNVFSYGNGGAGFGIQENNPLNNVQIQAANAEVHDIYILWASTNDLAKNIPIGDIRSTDLHSQAGGIRKSVEILQLRNPYAKIYFFTSLPFFKQENSLEDFVIGQKAVCADLHIPVLDQFYMCGFNQWNAQYFYNADLVHLPVKGYERIAEMQVAFLANPISGY